MPNLDKYSVNLVIKPMIEDLQFICTSLNISFEQLIAELYMQYLWVYHPGEAEKAEQRGKVVKENDSLLSG